MSYPYSQYAGDNYSSAPATPHGDFPEWETVERELQKQQQEQDQQQQQQQEQDRQQQQQQQQREQQQQQQLASIHSTPPYQTIQLEEIHPTTLLEASPTAAAHIQSPLDSTALQLQHIQSLIQLEQQQLRQQQQQRQFESSFARSDITATPGEHRLPPILNIDTTSSSSSRHPGVASTSKLPSPINATSLVPLRPLSALPAPSATATSMLVRSGRSTQTRLRQIHPYQRPPPMILPRPQSALAGSSTSTRRAPGMPLQPRPQGGEREHHVRFLSQQPLPPPIASSMSRSSSSSMPSPAVPSPLSAGRITSFAGSTVSSPVQRLPATLPELSRRSETHHHHHEQQQPAQPPQNPPPQDDSKIPRYSIRMDRHYEPQTKILTLMFELPGVKRDDLTVTLSTCPFNRVKQLTVHGVSRPMFPAASAGDVSTVRERRFGYYARTIAVQSDIKLQDIDAQLDSGILTLRVYSGIPAEDIEAVNIPIR